MNRYERYAAKLGFVGATQVKTKNPPDEVVAISFEDLDLATVRRALGKSRHFKPNLFFYRLSKTKALRIDTTRNILLMANSARAVAAFAKTVN